MFNLAANAQDGDGYLANFSGNSYKNSALLQWTTKIGFSCSDIKIEHSLDSLKFESIYTWPGICGATSQEIDYTYQVPSLATGIYHYFKLNMGFYGTSSFIKVFVPLAVKTALVVPNPATFESKIVYNLESGESAKIEIYNSHGDTVFSMMETFENNIELKNLGLPNGLYCYKIITNSKIFSGKFIYL